MARLSDSAPGIVIISRTPFRISLAGGGSDIPDYYRICDGSVVTMAVTLYMYVTVHRRFDRSIRIAYNKLEIVDSVDAVQHELIREALRMVGITSGVEVTTIGDVPGGTGLGSSSSLTVGVLNALYAYVGTPKSAAELAERAAAIEIDVLGRPIGRQDQFIAAYGGIRQLIFHRDGRVGTQQLLAAEADHRRLTDRLLLFYTGVERDANTILHEVKQAIATDPQRRQALDGVVRLTHDLARQLERGDFSAIGEALNRSWMEKRRMGALVTNANLDFMHERALNAGASGAKILGAGGGGFMLVACEPDHRPQVLLVMGQLGLRQIPFDIEPAGTSIIFPATV